jgi:CheY-like chemotaxis protein
MHDTTEFLAKKAVTAAKGILELSSVPAVPIQGFDYQRALREIAEHIERICPQPPTKVLIIEDDKDDACHMCRVLRPFHCVVSVAHDPTEAVDLMRQATYDLVFFDMIMPKMSGLELMQSTVGLSPGTHFVLVTGYPTATPEVDEVLKMKAILVPKPLTAEVAEIFLRKRPNE